MATEEKSKVEHSVFKSGVVDDPEEVEDDEYHDAVHEMKFPYNAVEYFDEFDDDIMKLKMKECADTLHHKGHTCVHIGSYYVGWCSYEICENNNDPKSALD